jgi:hypothetical protein
MLSVSASVSSISSEYPQFVADGSDIIADFEQALSSVGKV